MYLEGVVHWFLAVRGERKKKQMPAASSIKLLIVTYLTYLPYLFTHRSFIPSG